MMPIPDSCSTIGISRAAPGSGYALRRSPAVPSRRPAARLSAAQRGLGMQHRIGEGIRGALGWRPGKDRLGNAVRIDANGSANAASRCATHLYCAHVAYETTRDVVGRGDPNRAFLDANGQVQWEVAGSPPSLPLFTRAGRASRPPWQATGHPSQEARSPVRPLADCAVPYGWGASRLACGARSTYD